MKKLSRQREYQLRRKDEERVMSALEDYIAAPNGCWIWCGYMNDAGYGQIKYEGRTQYAHRLALERCLGRKLKPKMDACHKCDTPLCVRPAHLFEGTRTDNVRDAMLKGRMNPRQCNQPQGVNHCRAKLTEAQVREIRDTPGRTAIFLERFSISRTTVKAIRARRIWRHLP